MGRSISPRRSIESSLVSAVIGYLYDRRHYVLRTNSGVAWSRDGKHPVRLCPRGTPDIHAMLTDGTGRLLVLEAKAPGARTDPELAAIQDAVLERVARQGGIAAKIDSIDQIAALLEDVAAARASDIPWTPTVRDLRRGT